ncbi:hypothetical protein [Tenacibaculum sp. M341]|uniref:hypothetical protein n=1 Tax=Tenacibaculum sp. M341 TaxID=2530339 RepID=UPI001042E688|nr:hypothetical protein [Tenacibaculum sp. M341]TCI90758.1 hypothetical protein EYW44_13635 [Tenacibaculum sp. M341]
MKKKILKPYVFVLILIIVTLLFGVYNKEEVIDINIHDTYFVFEGFYFSIFISLIIGLLSLGYWFILKSNRKINSWLTYLHISLTVLGGLLYYKGVISMYADIINLAKHHESFEISSIYITVGFFTFLLAQLLYLINLFIALINRKKG